MLKRSFLISLSFVYFLNFLQPLHAFEDYVDELGTERFPPINNGLFFLENKYIAAPYVFERRGNTVFLNDIKIDTIKGWPTSRPIGIRDPRDPPPGHSPLNTPDVSEFSLGEYLGDPWIRKWAYLRANFNEDTARGKYTDVLNGHNTVLEVKKYSQPSSSILSIVFIDSNGKERTFNIHYADKYVNPSLLDKEVFVERIDLMINSKRESMEGKHAILMGAGPDIMLNKVRIIQFLETLLSDMNRDDKIRSFEESQLDSDIYGGVIDNLDTAGGKLHEKLAALKKEREQELINQDLEMQSKVAQLMLEHESKDMIDDVKITKNPVRETNKIDEEIPKESNKVTPTPISSPNNTEEHVEPENVTNDNETSSLTILFIALACLLGIGGGLFWIKRAV